MACVSSKELVAKELSSDPEIKSNYDRERYEKIKVEYDKLEDDNEAKVKLLLEPIQELIDRNSIHSHQLLLAYISGLNRGLDYYISVCQENNKPIIDDIVKGILKDIDRNNNENEESFWTNCEDDQFYCLFDAIEARDFSKLKELLSTIPTYVRLMTRTVTSMGEGWTSVHQLLKLDDVSDEKKIEVMNWFFEGVHCCSFVGNYPMESLLKAAMSNCGTTVLKELVERCRGNESYKPYLLYHNLRYAEKVSCSSVDKFEFMFDVSGRDILKYIEQVEVEQGESIGDCGGTLFIKKQFFECRKRDWARILSVLDEKAKRQSHEELHFKEDIVYEAMTKWISVQEYICPKNKRTLRDSREAVEDVDVDDDDEDDDEDEDDLPEYEYEYLKNGYYSPQFDFNHCHRNPYIEVARLRQFILEHGLYSESEVYDEIDLMDLFPIARECGDFKGAYPTMDEIYAQRKMEKRRMYDAKSWKWSETL